MKQGVLVDTGPLVAFLNKRDRFHDWTAAQWNQIAAPMLTCEAVVSETCFLLSGIKSGSNRVIQLIQRKILRISFHLEEHIDPVNKLLIKYQSVPMSLADACLVRMSELHSNSSVFTLDSDFNLYRKNGRQVIPSIMPG
ncbi:MAG: PIN domain-containing protein [Desulfobacteraceae bacterium]|nr:PIN domain-containing protein [Desulfobacteraceae bacterium]